MKHHHVRRLGLTLLALATAVALTACSGGSPAATTATTGGTATGSAPADYTGQTFTVWHYESANSAMGLAWAKAVDIFKTEHPGITVNVEPQTFEQIQKNAKIILTGDTVPDVMEYNKGNATAGQLASQGLLTPLTDVAKARGWDKIVTGALATTAMYNDQGLMGSGDWYGVTNYGEYVTVYYNKDMFDAQGLKVPTTYDQFVAAMQTFVAAGITPLAAGGAEYPMQQIWYQLVLSQSNRDFVNAYQLFNGDVDWQSDAMIGATDTLRDWVDKGYISKDAAGLTAEDMGTSFIAGKYPIMMSGSWWFGRLKSEIKFNWGQFLFPGNELNTGSSGNLWVVPDSAKNKDLAYDFIDITLRPEVQNILGENGGLPVSGDPAGITDESVRVFTQNFQTAVNNDQLAFYPDWPVAGFYDQLVSGFQSVVNGTKSSQEVMSTLGDYYKSGKADIVGG
ncbi:MAG: extracellular solute-binding protein [Propionibacteriaceae bacterium]|jgi:raffinose/stachyose/melibiose transport system substrate-binding protein|nr:extracellular solute-binding protein [Propionibacteriaceae bacterium]